MSTKAEILERIANVADDEIIAVPTVWTKATAEEVYEYAKNEEIELSLEQWAKVVEDYENAEFYDDEAMVEAIKLVLES